jgi:hypothetical protein
MQEFSMIKHCEKELSSFFKPNATKLRITQREIHRKRYTLNKQIKPQEKLPEFEDDTRKSIRGWTRCQRNQEETEH